MYNYGWQHTIARVVSCLDIVPVTALWRSDEFAFWQIAGDRGIQVHIHGMHV